MHDCTKDNHINSEELEVLELPDLNTYNDIIKAAKTGRLVIFVGAGVSKLIGLPLWKEFAFRKLDAIYDEGLVDYRTYCDLKDLDPKKLLTVCNLFIENSDIIMPSAKEIFKIKDNAQYKDIYGKLYSMNAIFVTTNYDECLDKCALNITGSEHITVEDSACNDNINAISRKKDKKHLPLGEVIFDQSDLLESKLQNGNVVHIHGSVNDEKNMIVTLNDYMLHYGNLSKDNHPELSVFLDSIFNTKYVVLFVGYGLEEYEILEYMLSKVTKPEGTKMHYLLYPCFKEEKKLVNLLNKYYSDFGVELIPYDISRKGYKQLITIIDEWSKIINKVSNGQDYLQKMQFIDEVIADKSERFSVQSRAIIEMIKRDETLEEYLFKHVNDIRWLDIFIDHGYYNPEKIPSNINKGNGYYSVPYWVNTDYLKKILSNEEKLTEKVIRKVLSIIHDISIYRDNEGNAIDNYHVWSQFIEVIEKIPNEYITCDFLESITIWTKSEFKIDFIIGKLGLILLHKFLKSNYSDDFEKSSIIINIVTSLDKSKKSLVINDYYFMKLFDLNTIELIAKKCSIDFINNYINRIIETLHKGSNANLLDYNKKAYIIELDDDGEKYLVSIINGDKVLFNREIKYCDVIKFTNIVIEWLYSILDKTQFKSNLNMIIRNLYFGLYSKTALYSLYATHHRFYSESSEQLLHFYKDILTIKYQTEDADEDKFICLNNLFQSRYFALVKVALYIIGNVSDKYLPFFWTNLDSDTMRLVFQESYFADELRVILENIEIVDSEQETKIIKLIEDGPGSDVIDPDYIKIWKIERLNSLKHIKYFEEYRRDHYQEDYAGIKLGPAISEANGSWASDKSPLNQDDLYEMNSKEISGFISNFREENKWNSTSTEGLAKSLREYTKSYPNKFDADLMPFINSAFYYIFHIFNGFIDACKERKILNWNNILDFIINYINRNEFWEDAYQYDMKINHKMIITIFTDLINEGTREDNRTFEYGNIQKAKEIILLILDRISNYNEKNIDEDYILYVYNSIKGRALEALINLSLYITKKSSITKNQSIDNWDKELHDMYNRYIDSNIVDAYILLGEYLPQFIYLNTQWTTHTVNHIQNDDINWEGFMVGYIYSREIYKDIYLLMKNHYNHSINFKFKKEDVVEELINHIALGYLCGFENEINNLLYNSIIDKWDYKMISKMLWHFWTYCDKFDSIIKDGGENNSEVEEIRSRIICFWNTLYVKYKEINSDELNENDKNLISDSIRLIEVLDSIDEESVMLISFAIPYAEINYNTSYVIEKLNKLTTENDSVEKRSIIGNLILDLVKYNVPTYPQDKIIELVQYLYIIRDDILKEYSDKICNIYASHNIEFLRDLCLEYRDF